MSASECDLGLFLCDVDHDDLYEDLQQPFTRTLFNSIFFKAQTKQKHEVMYPEILVQLRIIDFLSPF